MPRPLHRLPRPLFGLLAVSLIAGSTAQAVPDRSRAGCVAEHELRTAARAGDLAAVREQLAAGVPVDPSRGCSHYRTALDLAAEQGHIEIARVLAAHGANRWGASMYALAERDDPKLIAAILDGTPENEIADRRNDALAEACQNGRVASARWLLAAGADPNSGPPATGGQAPLLAAARANAPELLPSLFAAGGKATPEALRSAAIAGRFGSVRLLLDRGIDPHTSWPDGNLISNVAAATGPSQAAAHARIAELLLELDVDPNLPARGRSPLLLARLNGNPELAKLLEAAGASGGTTVGYKLDRFAGILRGALYGSVLVLGGGH